MTQQGANKWHISQVEFSTYYTYYHRVTPLGALLGGSRAREFFMQTKLPTQILRHIWNLADIDNDGQLNPAEFAVAMHLTRVALADHTNLPNTCPSPLITLVRQTLYPQLPVANQAHLDKCKKAFGAFFENIGKGVLGGEAARYLMLKSNLPKPQLFHIWKLSDIDCDGRLNFKEFTIAMHLIFIAKLGYTLPVDLDPNTILPPTFYQILKEVQSAAESMPIISSPSDDTQPPLTPLIQETQPTFFAENPFVSDAFVNLPARHFQEGHYDDYVGNPFKEIAENGHSVHVKSGIASSSNGHEVIQNGHQSVSPDETESSEVVQNGVSRSSPIQATVSCPREGRTSPQSPSPQVGGRGHLSTSSFSQASSKESLGSDHASNSSLHKGSGNPASNTNLRQTGCSSPMLSSQESLESQDSVGKLSLRLTSSQESMGKLSPRLRGSRESIGKLPPLVDSAGKSSSLGGSRESLGRLSPQLGGSDRGSSSSLSHPGSGGVALSQESVGSSSSQRSRRRSNRSSTASFQEVVVEERVEPVLQLPTAVDVVGSRETTPVPDREDMGAERVSDELESLSRASRQFLEESQSKLREQQRRNLSHIVPEKYQKASLRGLSGTITDMETGSTSSSPHSRESSLSDKLDYDDEDIATADMISQLDDLEAEILSQLDDADFDLDDVDEGEENVSIDEDQIEVGALNLGVSSDVYQDEDRKTPVSETPVIPVVNGDDSRVQVNGVTEEVAVKGRVNNMASLHRVKEEQRKRRSQYLEAAMDELDNFLEDELGEINDMFQEFQTKDKESEEKRQKEQQDLMNMERKLKEHQQQQQVSTLALPDGETAEETAESAERIARRKKTESQKITEEWEKEMAELEAEALKDLQKRNMAKEMESDTLVVSLDAELQSLIKHEEEAVKIAQKEKELLAARRKAEEEQRERERKERLMRNGNKEEMTIEEWIEWMEEKKKAGMTPEQLEELERRKAIWMERQKQREEKRKREEEEQLAKTRSKMEAELRAIRQRDQEIKKARLTDEELLAKQREKARKDQEESDQRKERSRQVKEAMRKQELEDMKPKAKSALAARWEERIKARSDGKISREENKTTVLTGGGMESVKREEERLTRRISGRPKSTSSSDGLEDLGAEEGMRKKSIT